MVKYLNKNLILKIDTKINKSDVINKLIDLAFEKTDFIEDKEKFIEKIFAREDIGTTGIGRGIGVPHARCEDLKNIVFAIALCKEGIEDYQTPDGEKAKLAILVGAPKSQNDEYLKLLARLSKSFRLDEYRNSVLLAKDLDELIEAIAQVV